MVKCILNLGRTWRRSQEETNVETGLRPVDGGRAWPLRLRALSAGRCRVRPGSARGQLRPSCRPTSRLNRRLRKCDRSRHGSWGSDFASFFPVKPVCGGPAAIQQASAAQDECADADRCNALASSGTALEQVHHISRRLQDALRARQSEACRAPIDRLAQSGGYTEELMTSPPLTVRREGRKSGLSI